MRSLTLLLITALLAGCTEPDASLDSQDVDPKPDQSPEPEDDPATPSEPPTPARNEPPTASLTAQDMQGTAPYNITFTLDGDDADGDNLYWTFDRDDDGTIDDQGDALPATVTHAYEVGEWTARLTVFDGADEAEATLLVEAFEEEVPKPEPVVFEETALLMAGPTYQEVGAMNCISFLTGENGLDCVFFAFSSPYDGRAWTSTSTGEETFVDFWDSCDPTEGSSLQAGHGIEGTVPDGAGCAILFANGSTPGATISLTIH